MKKTFKALSLFALLSVGTFIYVGCNNKNPQSSITQTTQDVDHFIVKGLDDLKNEYSLEEIIDISKIRIELYDNDNKLINTIDAYDSNVVIEGIDTNTVGEKTMSICYLSLTPVEFKYSVNAETATLYLNGGNVDGKEIIEVKSVNGQISLGDISPTSNDPTKIFAGWFYDEELTERVEYTTEGYINSAPNLKIYAGYDIDYSSLFNYEIDKTTSSVKIIGVVNDYSALMSINELVIPETIELYPVTEVGDNIFVVYNELIGEEIDISSFLWELEEVRFPEHSYIKKIGKNAFSNLQIEEVNLPEGLINIGESAFGNCSKLKSISFPSTVQRIEDSAFCGCISLKEITFSDYGSLVYIGKNAFGFANEVFNIKLPEGLEQISSFAFSNCEKLERISIPSTVNFIGVHAFKELNNLAAFEVSKNNKYFCSIDGNLFSKDATKIYAYCFGKNETIYTIPNSVTSIEESCFNVSNGFSMLEKIILPNGLKEIYDEAFKDCSASITIPASVEKITDKAFYYYKTDKYSISPNNPYFSVDSNGFLYNKDFSELLSIPRNTECTELLLDNRVKTIRSFAVVGTSNLRTIKVEKDSKLETIEENALCLNTIANLNTFWIEKENPCNVFTNSFTLYENLVANRFIILTKDEYINDYVEAWGECYFDTFYAPTILDLLYSYSNCFDFVKKEIAKMGFTTFEHYKKGVNVYAKENYSTIKYIMPGTIGLIESLYLASYVNLSSEESDYLCEVEKNIYKVLLEYFSVYKQNDDFENQRLYNALAHYSNLPQKIKIAVKDDYNKLKEIGNKIKVDNESKASIINEIVNFECSNETFDVEKYLELLSKINEINFENLIYPYSVSVKLSIMKCSYLMYQFVNCKGDYIHHIPECLEYLNGLGNEYSGNYGIISYINFILTDNEQKESIYKYPSFEECYEEFCEVETQYNNKMFDDIMGVDLSLPFNEDEYLAAIEEFGLLAPNAPTSMDVIEKYWILSLRYDVNAYVKYYENIDDDNFISAKQDIQVIDYIIDTYGYSELINEEMENEIKAYQEKKAEATDYLAAKFKKVKEEIISFDMTKETFDEEAYQTLVNDYNYLSICGNEINYCDSDDYYDYSSLYTIISVYRDIYKLVTSYSNVDVNGSNYEDIDKKLYGDYTLSNTEDITEGIFNRINSITFDSFDELKAEMYYYASFEELVKKFNEF